MVRPAGPFAHSPGNPTTNQTPRPAQRAIPKYRRYVRTISTSTEPRNEDDQENGNPEQEDFHSWTTICSDLLFWIDGGAHLCRGRGGQHWSCAGNPMMARG
jgi:hypothetical protein